MWGGARARNGETWAQIERRGAARVRLAGLGRRSRTRRRTRLGSAASASRRSPRACPTAPAAPAATRCCRARWSRRRAACRSAPSCASRPIASTSRRGRRGRADGPRPRAAAARRARVRLALPAGWRGDEGAARSAGCAPDRDATATLRVTRASTAPSRAGSGSPRRCGRAPGRARAPALVRIVPAVRGTLQPLPQVADFRAWAARAGRPQLDSLVHPVASLATGETRERAHRPAQLRRRRRPGGHRRAAAAGRLRRRRGRRSRSTALAPGGTRGGHLPGHQHRPLAADLERGRRLRLRGSTTVAGGARSTATAALNLVPVTTVPSGGRRAGAWTAWSRPASTAAAALDLSRLWEGDEPDDARRRVRHARRLTWSGDALYLLVDVIDDELGTVLARSDAKRHWRTDSVEVAIDPRGDSENTSTTFKVGAFPTTARGRACGLPRRRQPTGPGRARRRPASRSPRG